MLLVFDTRHRANPQCNGSLTQAQPKVCIDFSHQRCFGLSASSHICVRTVTDYTQPLSVPNLQPNPNEGGVGFSRANALNHHARNSHLFTYICPRVSPGLHLSDGNCPVITHTVFPAITVGPPFFYTSLIPVLSNVNACTFEAALCFSLETGFCAFPGFFLERWF